MQGTPKYHRINILFMFHLLQTDKQENKWTQLTRYWENPANAFRIGK